MSLSAKELSDIRDVADDWLPDTCTIQTKTESVDGLGGISYSWTNTYTSISCRLDPMFQGDEEITNDALEGESVWILTVAYDQDIDVEYRIVHNSLTYEIRNIIADLLFYFQVVGS